MKFTALWSTVQVISAHNLPKPLGSGAKGEVIDPYVVLELHGVPADCAEQRTRTAAQNQDDPLFDETFEFQVRRVSMVYTGVSCCSVDAGLFVYGSLCICEFIFIVTLRQTMQFTHTVKLDNRIKPKQYPTLLEKTYFSIC